jgi:hypothetical protein
MTNRKEFVFVEERYHSHPSSFSEMELKVFSTTLAFGKWYEKLKAHPVVPG